MSITSKFGRQISNYDSRDSLGSRLRAQRIAPLLEIIDAVFQQQGCVRIIDIGGTENYWNIIPKTYLQERHVSITIVNLPGMVVSADHGLFTFIEGDACHLESIENHSFHIAHSNSVVEHVGDWQRMVQFAHEISRVAPSYFVQTPNYWFPVEPHFMTPFFHWLPKSVRVWLIAHFQLGHRHRAPSIKAAIRSVESVRLLTKRQFQELFQDGEIRTEQVLGLPKSFIAVRKALSLTTSSAEPSNQPEYCAHGTP